MSDFLNQNNPNHEEYDMQSYAYMPFGLCGEYRVSGRYSADTGKWTIEGFNLNNGLSVSAELCQGLYKKAEFPEVWADLVAQFEGNAWRAY